MLANTLPAIDYFDVENPRLLACIQNSLTALEYLREVKKPLLLLDLLPPAAYIIPLP